MQQDYYLRPQTELADCDTAVIVPSLSLKNKLVSKLASLAKGRDAAPREIFVAGSIQLVALESTVILGPLIGAPLAVIATENLFCSGVKRLVVIGIGGALNLTKEEFSVGDIIFPRGIISEEGTSRHYGGKQRESFEINVLQDELEKAAAAAIARNHFLLEAGTSCHSGYFWSTDAPYRETQKKALLYRKQGAVLVEMEFAALRQVASCYGVELGAAYAVSDLLSKSWTSGFSSKVFRETLSSLGNTVVEILSRCE